MRTILLFYLMCNVNVKVYETCLGCMCYPRTSRAVDLFSIYKPPEVKTSSRLCASHEKSESLACQASSSREVTAPEVAFEIKAPLLAKRSTWTHLAQRGVLFWRPWPEVVLLTRVNLTACPTWRVSGGVQILKHLSNFFTSPFLRPHMWTETPCPGLALVE